MSQNTDQRHPFLDDLTPDATLAATMLRAPLAGRHAIRLAVETVGTFYASQKATFAGTIGSRLVLEYEAVLTSGETLSATVIAERNPDGSVSRVSVRMSPLGAALTLSAGLRQKLSQQLLESLFL